MFFDSLMGFSRKMPRLGTLVKRFIFFSLLHNVNVQSIILEGVHLFSLYLGIISASAFIHKIGNAAWFSKTLL